MSDYNVDTLENKIVVEAQEAIKSLEQIIGYVKDFKSAVDSLKSATGLKAVNKEAKKATSSLTKMQLISSSLKKALNLGGLIYGARRLFNFMTDATGNSIDYIETLNLFEVSMGKTIDQYGNLDTISSKYYTKAINFQNRLNEAFGTNIEETMRYQALYNQMAKSMGINNQASYTISENLTKLGIDLSSLFNRDESATMEALRAGVLAGQTKPLRNYGLDVTQQTLTPLLSELGINKTVNQLSQAEKMILRYIAVIRQASAAHGDFAKTIESPANQLKVFKQQLNELKTAAGNLFQGILGQILPWVNAILMVIKELIKAIGSLFGFKVSSQSNNLAKATGVEELEAGLGGAAGAAKELKAQIMGFDEINNITIETSSGGGGGGISTTGIDSKLLDAMKDYDNLMGNVKMKATEIRDKIMDWLGFTKVINPLTGEVSFKLRDGWTNLKKIWTLIKGLVGIGIAVKIVKLIGSITTLWGVLKGTQAATTSFGVGLQTLSSIYIKTTPGVGKHAEAVKTLNMTAVKATVGIAGLTVATYEAYKSMNEFAKGTKTATETAGSFALSIGGAAAAGALLGSVIPGVGTVLGALAGATIAASSALIGYATGINDATIQTTISSEEVKVLTESLKENKRAFENTLESINNNAQSQLIDMEYSRRLSAELENLVDSNGKVKKGYEDRVDFILKDLSNALGIELQRNGDIIKQNGEIVRSYEGLQQSIEGIIKAKEEEIKKDAILELNKENIKRQIQLELEKKKVYGELEKAINDYNNAVDDGMNKWTITWSKKQREICQNVITLKDNYDDLDRQYQEVSNNIIDYTALMTDGVMGELVKQTEAIGEMTPGITEQWKSLAEQSNQKYNEALNNLEETTREKVKNAVNGIVNETNNAVPEVQNAAKNINNALNQNLESTTKVKFKLESDYSSLIDGLKNIKNSLGQITGSVGEAFNPLKSALTSAINKMRGFAVGGFPDMGEIFMARESGPELVGKIGSRTAVANNQQIVEAVSRGVYSAVSAAMQSGTTTVQLDVRADEGIIVRKASQGFREHVMQTGELPFPIPI